MAKHLKYLLLCFALFVSALVKAQNGWKQELFIPVKAERFFADNLGNVYIQHKKELIKYNQKGEEKNRFSDKLLGQAASIDVTNPMKIVVYFAELTQVLFLDNTLSQQAVPLALEELGFEQTLLVCYSYNNGLWLYDFNTFELIRLNENLEITHRTGNINQVTGSEIEPVFMVERNNQLYVSDLKKGILVFDVFGTYLKTIPINNVLQFDVHKGILFFNIGQKLYKYNIKALKQEEVMLPEKEFLQAEIHNEKLYLQTAAGIKVYTHKN